MSCKHPLRHAVVKIFALSFVDVSEVRSVNWRMHFSFLLLFHYILLFYSRSIIIVFCFRFGSFEIFKTVDPLTGYQGPSAGRLDILHQLLNYTIDNFFPQVNYCFCFNKCVLFNTKTTTMIWSINVGVLSFIVNHRPVSSVG